MDWLPPKSPLVNGLLIQNRFWNWAISSLSFILRTRRRFFSIPKPKKILLSNLANYGDLVISTTVLPVLKKHFPDCEIGFLAGNPMGQQVLGGHPSITWIHEFGHFYLNRARLGKCKAVLHHWKSRRKVIREIRRIGYDVAIDLYPYFPNAIPLFAQCRIPVRIGYPTGGFSKLLTHSAKWDFADRYVGYAALHLLEFLGIDLKDESCLPSYRKKEISNKAIVIHMGTADRKKEWGCENWVHLIRKFQGEKIYLTGSGKREEELCRKVAESTSAVNLCGKLAWEEFVSTIQGAKLLIAVDSVPVHIAAGSLTPTVVLFTGINSPYMWVPPSPVCKRVIKRVSCAPCFNKKGCAEMSCIQGILVNDVYKSAVGLLCKVQM